MAMGDYHSITVTERILDSEDSPDKKKFLQRYKDSLVELDNNYFNLVTNIIVSEDQAGEIIDALLFETQLFHTQNNNLLDQLEQQINIAVDAFDEQVDDMKVQRMTITYEDTPTT